MQNRINQSGVSGSCPVACDTAMDSAAMAGIFDGFLDGLTDLPLAPADGSAQLYQQLLQPDAQPGHVQPESSGWPHMNQQLSAASMHLTQQQAHQFHAGPDMLPHNALASMSHSVCMPWQAEAARMMEGLPLNMRAALMAELPQPSCPQSALHQPSAFAMGAHDMTHLQAAPATHMMAGHSPPTQPQPPAAAPAVLTGPAWLRNGGRPVAATKAGRAQVARAQAQQVAAPSADATAKKRKTSGGGGRRKAAAAAPASAPPAAATNNQVTDAHAVGASFTAAAPAALLPATSGGVLSGASSGMHHPLLGSSSGVSHAALPLAAAAGSSGGSGDLDNDGDDGLWADGEHLGSGGGGGLGGGAGGPSALEKNRTAQRRFRERQKAKMVDLEAKVDGLTAKLAQMGSQNKQLQHMNRLLEKVLQLRDEHITGLQEAVRVFHQEGYQARQPSRPRAEPSPEGGDRKPRADGSTDCDADVASRSGTSDQCCMDPDHPGAAAAVSAALDGELQRPPNPMHKYTPEFVADLDEPGVMSEYQTHIEALRNALARLEEEEMPDPTAIRDVELVCSRIGALSERVAMYKPKLIKYLMTHNCTTGESSIAASDDHWRSVVARMQMSSEQLAEVQQERSRFLAALKQLLKERRAVQALLASRAMPAAMTHTNVLAAGQATHEAMERLRANVVNEHNLHMEFCVFFFKSAGPLGAARAMVASFPWYPDPLAISSIAAADAAAAAAPSSGGDGGRW